MVKKKIGLNIRFLFVFIDVVDEKIINFMFLIKFLKIIHNNIQKI
jgi:hypothetical protein